MNCHANVRMLQKQSARILGVQSSVVQNYRDKTGLWKPTAKETNRALAIQSGRAKKEEWDTGKAALRTLYIGPNSKPEQHMAVAWREEMLAVKQWERKCSWSKHPDAQVTAMDRYYENIEQERERSRLNAKNRYWRLRNDPAFRAKRAIRNTTSRIKRKVKTARKSNELLGVSVVDARRHIESQFMPGMTWQNHGDAWEIDHIYPIAAADLLNEDHIRIVANVGNLRPLWKNANRAKRDRVDVSLHKIPVILN
jgi:hypothetical protein